MSARASEPGNGQASEEKTTPPLAHLRNKTHSAVQVGIVAQMPSLNRVQAAVPVHASLEAAQTGLTLVLGVAIAPRAARTTTTTRRATNGRDISKRGGSTVIVFRWCVARD